MRLSVISLFFLAFSIRAEAQYDFYIKSILKEPAVVPSKLTGAFARKRNVDKPGSYYVLSNPYFPICYYPSEEDCGYFKLFDKQYLVKGKYGIGEVFGCDLDGESFEAFQLKVSERSYLIITSIAISNGKGTRDVFCQLFDVTDKKNVVYYPLWSVYGSFLSFGDYDGDGRLDFLETRYELGSKDDDTFRLSLKTLSKDRKVFEDAKGKYIVFHQEDTDKLPKVTVTEKHW